MCVRKLEIDYLVSETQSELSGQPELILEWTTEGVGGSIWGRVSFLWGKVRGSKSKEHAGG